MRRGSRFMPAGKALAVLAAGVLACCMTLTVPSVARAQNEEASLSQEANRLTYQILDLRARRDAALREGDALRAELENLDRVIAANQEEMATLELELSRAREAYRESLRRLYMQGDLSELEVILESRELDEMWRDVEYLDRMAGLHLQDLRDLKDKLSRCQVKERDLREYRERRKRLAEALDAEVMERRIQELESRLSDINARLRELRSARAANPTPAPTSAPSTWTLPPPGKLLDRVPVMPALSDFERTGIVFSGYTTFYGPEWHGKPTSSGVIYNMYDYTCAHRTLPFGTWLLVTYQGKQVIVQVNNRGPFVPGRVLDLSWAAAQSIGLRGVKWTEFEILVPRGG
ncbi:MAG: septal ring lytic transglycosylase RlpA family protein [Actinomycetota bacterium]|nr:septal ring lytic transglycosylase RlpA family protein [Actinomycetota bacterium]